VTGERAMQVGPRGVPVTDSGFRVFRNAEHSNSRLRIAVVALFRDRGTMLELRGDSCFQRIHRSPT
jgi:hypothetical protein